MVRGSMLAAARHLEVAHRLDPDNAEVLFDLASAAQESGDFDAALRWGRGAIERDPNHDAALNFVGYLLAERGVELGESEALIRRALALEPDNAAYIDSLGWVLYKRGDFATATLELERAARASESRDPTILEHLGDAYLGHGRIEAALEAYTRAVTLPGGRDEVHAKRARLLALLDKH
jgi:Flp pilus assembly protein TadD